MGNDPENRVPERVDLFIGRVEELTGLNLKIDPEVIGEMSAPLTYNRNQLEALTPEECMYASHNLSRYIFYLSNVIGRTKAKHHWFEIQLNRALGEFMHLEFNDIYGNEAKKNAAIMSRPETQEIYQKILFSNTTLHRLIGIIDSVKLLKQDINDIKIYKMMKQKTQREDQ